MKEGIEKSAISAISRQKGIDPATVTLDSTLADLGISSLDAITIMYDMEEEFDIEIPNEKLDQLQTVRDMVEGIASLIEAGH